MDTFIAELNIYTQLMTSFWNQETRIRYQTRILKKSDFLLLTFTTFWANSEDDRLVILFLFFPENKL